MMNIHNFYAHIGSILFKSSAPSTLSSNLSRINDSIKRWSEIRDGGSAWVRRQKIFQVQRGGKKKRKKWWQFISLKGKFLIEKYFQTVFLLMLLRSKKRFAGRRQEESSQLRIQNWMSEARFCFILFNFLVWFGEDEFTLWCLLFI